jgi:hypothetical protein
MNNTLTVVSIFRNEANILKEWLDHYIVRGVTKFHLINDRSDDNFLEVLKVYIEQGIVHLHESSEPHDLIGRQNKIYETIFEKISSKLDWVLMIDLDEFVWNTKNLSLLEYVKDLESQNVFIERIFMDDFGDNDILIQPNSVVSTFKRRALRRKRRINFGMTKSLFKYSKAGRIKFQHVSLKAGDSIKILNSSECNLRLNHYKMQSLQRWAENIVHRGSANGTEAQHLRHSWTFFHRYKSKMNEIEDLGLIEQNEKYKNEILSNSIIDELEKKRESKGDY